MAKIVGWNEKYLFKGTCSKCTAIIECTELETTRRSYTDYGGGNDLYYTCPCPNCSNSVEVFKR